MPGILLPTDYHPPTPTPGPATIREVKSSLLDKPDHAFDCELVAVETTVGAAAAIILYRMPRAITIFGIDMPEGSFTLGYFWQDRPYNVYHWLDPDERTLAYYANIADRTAITTATIAWRDLVVDVLVRPTGAVEVLDEDELPADLPPTVARRIDQARAALVDGAAALATEIEQASQAWLAARR